MAKIAIKSEKLTPFGGIFSIMEQFAPLPSLCLPFAFPLPFLSAGDLWFRANTTSET